MSIERADSSKGCEGFAEFGQFVECCQFDECSECWKCSEGSGRSMKRAVNEKEASENAMKANGAFSPRQTNASNETKQPAEEQFDMLKRRKLLFEDDSSSDESSDIEMSDWIVCGSNRKYGTVSSANFCFDSTTFAVASIASFHSPFLPIPTVSRSVVAIETAQSESIPSATSLFSRLKSSLGPAAPPPVSADAKSSSASCAPSLLCTSFAVVCRARTR